MELLRTPSRSAIHRGAITLLEAAIYIVITIVVVSLAMTQGGGLFNKNDTSIEISNAGEIMFNAPQILKTGGIYKFNGADDMTGELIRSGGAPANMTVVGTKASGTAKLQNVFGGAVTVQPVATSGGEKTSFSLTYGGVPQESCIVMAAKLSAIPKVVASQINGTTTNGPVASSEAGAQCTADSGSAGQNTLTFTSST
jgi:hypothetical protein